MSQHKYEVDYWVTTHISLEETKKHMTRLLRKGTKATIHQHAKDDVCPGNCEVFEI